MSENSNGDGCKGQPIIVRSAAGRYVFAGTQVDVAHVVAAVPAGHDGQSLKVRWCELDDEQIEVAKILGLAHAIGEGQASGDVDGTMEEVLSHPNLAEQVRDEINAWKGLKAAVEQFPRSERGRLIRGAEAAVSIQVPYESVHASYANSPTSAENQPSYPELQELQPAVSRLNSLTDVLRRAEAIAWQKETDCEYLAEPEPENGVWLEIGVTERGLCYWRVATSERNTGGGARSLEEAAVVAEAVYWISFQGSKSD